MSREHIRKRQLEEEVARSGPEPPGHCPLHGFAHPVLSKRQNSGRYSCCSLRAAAEGGTPPEAPPRRSFADTISAWKSSSSSLPELLRLVRNLERPHGIEHESLALGAGHVSP